MSTGVVMIGTNFNVFNCRHHEYFETLVDTLDSAMPLVCQRAATPRGIAIACREATIRMSYSAAASQGGSNNDPAATRAAPAVRDESKSRNASESQQGAKQKRSPSPTHVPVTEKEGENIYVLTVLTDQAHHKRMTAIRNKYFPRKINKLDAHLTLFHALPGSRMDNHILPTIQAVASKTAKFNVHAVKPFRLKRGMAISVAKNHGSTQAQEVHRALQQPWLDVGFLSEQDQGGCRVHYTVMNKVEDDAEVGEALKELEHDFRGDWGMAEGLGLWRYDRGYWRWERRFDFDGQEGDSNQ